MAIEIRELIIRATVNTKLDTPDNQVVRKKDLALLKKRIEEDCYERVMDKLEDIRSKF